MSSDNSLNLRLADDIVRKPRLFYVSTSSTTSTLTTASICYVSTNTAPALCPGRRRKRTINYEIPENSNLANRNEEIVSANLHQSNLAALNEEKSGREGRFLLYWITTTSVSTSTSFTITYSISSVSCTPGGANLCG